MIALAISAGIAQAADLVTFAAVAARYGSAGESNPLMALTYDMAGISGVALLKGVTVLLTFLVAYAMMGAGAPTWIVVAAFVVSILLGFLGAASNVWALSL